MAKRTYACDPVIGDVGRGSYVAAGVGEFFRDRALPSATIATPNAFELEWLTGERAHDLQTARRAIALLRARGPQVVVAKSLMLDDTPADALDMLAGGRSGVLAAARPKAADCGQRRRRPVRGSFLPSLA